MLRTNLFFFIFCFFFNFLLSGQDYEFYGAVQLNGKKETAISYRLIFTEKNGVVKGFSITDITGEHETKNAIEGTYDKDKKILKFKEKNILYTKSPISDDLFCFIHYEGKIKLSAKKPTINGNFKGFFKNQSKCIDGTLTLIGSAAVMSLLNKANNKIQKSKELNESEKAKYNVIQIFDSLQTNQLTAKQNLNIFTNNTTASFEIWDKGKEDGDIINLYHNDVLILENYTVSKIRKKLDVSLSNAKNVFRIEAINEGTDSPNTAMIEMSGDKPIEFQSNLKKGEKASVTIIKQ